MLIGKRNEMPPIKRRNIVLAFPDMVADTPARATATPTDGIPSTDNPSNP